MQSKKKYIGTSLSLSEEISPLTKNQEKIFKDWENNNNLVLTGFAGTGKTFLALYFALKELENKKSPYQKIIIFRSAVATRALGFLPGDLHEKGEVYEEPYKAIVNTLYNRDDAYDILKKRNIIDFQTTSFLRGMTYDRTILFADEIQNMTEHELDTIITRIGEDTRFILSGDLRQSDLDNRREKTGFIDIINILKDIKGVKMTDFGINDIVRSGFVRDYIIAREKYYHG